MFEQETDSIIRTVAQRVPASGGTVAVKDILAADIPYPIKVFFRADVEAMLLAELRNHRKESRFDFNHPEIESLQNQINSLLVLRYTFGAEEFRRRLADTVHLLMNFHIRPQWTLSGVIFEKEETISAESLLGLLRYFGPYEYLREIVAHYIREKRPATFARADFGTLLWKADGEYIRRKSGDELARVMSPIYDFVDFPANSGTNAVPVRALIKYFEDKGLTAVLPQMEGELAQGTTALTRKRLGEILEEARRGCGAFTVERVTASPQDIFTAPVPEPAVPLPPAPRESGNGGVSLEQTMSEGEQKRFIKKIFGQDEAAFHNALRSMSTLPGWKETSRFIDEVFISHDVDPYSSDAKRFIEVIFEHFHPRA